MRDQVSRFRRIVVKVGSALVTNNGSGPDKTVIADWARQFAALRAEGKEVILVSSGAIATGIHRLGWDKRPHEMRKLQAAAAVGQMHLVESYEEAFSRHDMLTAQILLTHDDLSDRQRYLNARSTLRALLELGAVPIINENDTIVTDEIKFGDNDTLGALVANLVEADALVILTDQQGLYTADPRTHPDATLISEGRAEDRAYEAMSSGAGSALSKGGMITKVRAARRAARSGAHTFIVSGQQPDALVRLLRGEPLGTLLYASSSRLQARKQWLADHLQLTGSLVIDDGAVIALHNGRSLLPIGVTEIQGDFGRGTAIACLNTAGEEVARGLTNYSSSECRRIARHASNEVEQILGHAGEPELIHRDNMIITG